MCKHKIYSWLSSIMLLTELSYDNAYLPLNKRIDSCVSSICDISRSGKPAPITACERANLIRLSTAT